MVGQIIGSLIRALLAAGGGAGVVSGDELNQLAGAVSIIVTIVWSIVQKVRATQSTVEILD